jgi:putative ubiquitin-RnfH superfamily antitoxin RatB of RatAB toxin-antitoxin module
MSNITVEVAYALPEKQTLLSITLPADSTIEQAIVVSEIQKVHPQINLKDIAVGVFSRAAKLSDPLNEGDRVEIYRPLIADPKELRKLRAARAKASGKADKVTGGRPNKLRATPNAELEH